MYLNWTEILNDISQNLTEQEKQALELFSESSTLRPGPKTLARYNITNLASYTLLFESAKRKALQHLHQNRIYNTDALDFTTRSK